MKRDRQNRVLNNIVSPYGLALASYGSFLLACLLSPAVYSRYMGEPDLMFLDPATILFYTLCVASFVAGVWLVGLLYPSSLVELRFKTQISSVAFLLIPLALGITATAISTLHLIKQVPNLVVILLSQRGGSLKDTLVFDVEGDFTLIPLVLIGLIWWTFWRSSSLGLQGWRNRLVMLLLFIAVLSVIVSSTLTLSRILLMLVVCGLAILYVMRRALNKQLSIRFMLNSSLVIVIAISVLFFTFSFLRGAYDWVDQVRSLMGYTAASYNRLAAIVHGNLRYPFAGQGVYLSSVAAHSRLLLGGVINPPTNLEIWGSEFGAVSQAGLDGSLIWSGAFGYIFSELGWFSPLFVFGCGLLCGLVWNWMKRGKVIGVVLYPFCGFCVLFWFGTNYLLDRPAEILMFLALTLSIYELLFMKISKVSLREEAASA